SQSPLFFVATMKGPFQLEEVLETLKSQDIRHIRILPLLSIVGRHTLQDIAGDEPESWRSRLRAAGFQCTPVLRGLLEAQAVAGIWLQHLSNAQILSPSSDHAE
ncbi:MAG: sirohydrochlorin cobaltochelatase, partial [Desulfovibrionaceae bacterium]|nr:sirohydrochlorin cobaltochelatase [Desulfovibrionaceae bacterium]